MVDLALKMVLHDKLRFFITVAGVAFAVTLVLVQGGLFVGILDNATVTIEHLDADLWVTSKNTPNLDFVHDFPETYINRVRSNPSVERADNLILAFVNVALPTGAQETAVVYALENFRRWGFPWNVVEGGRRRSAARPQRLLRRLGDVTLRTLRRGRSSRSPGATTRGHRAHQGRQELHHHPARVHGLRPRAEPRPRHSPRQDVVHPRQAEARREHRECAGRAPRAAAVQRRLHEGRLGEPIARLLGQEHGIGFNMFLTVFLGCLVGVVVVAQTLYTSTMEHIKEFGTLKAIGGSNGDIYKILARQATLSAVIGFVLGAVPSFLLRPVVERARTEAHDPARAHGRRVRGHTRSLPRVGDGVVQEGRRDRSRPRVPWVGVT
jgi:putative ABC transport system permease protein